MVDDFLKDLQAKLRDRSGRDLDRLAERAGVSRSTVYGLRQNPDRGLRLSTLKALLEALE